MPNKSFIKSTLMVVLLAALSACGGGGGGEGSETGETEKPGFWGGLFSGNSDESLEGLGAEEIYKRADFALKDGKSKDAVELFNEVERLYPYSEFAKRALLMSAFAYHTDKEYEQARATAQRYIDFYPADEDAAYAQYLLAISYYEQISQVGRDQALTFQALQALRTVIELYPDSEFAGSASLKFDLAFDHLAGKEMEVGRYYLKLGHYSAAIKRFRVVVEEFQTTTHTAEALHRLVESYVSLGLTQEAQTAGAILGYNYQSSEFYRSSYELLQGQGLEPGLRGTGWLANIYRQAVRGKWL